MIRFVIRRKMLDRGSSLASEGLETVDAECPELERVLMGGGTGMDAYDYRELAGAEVLPPSKDQGLLREALAWIENSEQKAPSLCGDIRKALGLPDNAIYRDKTCSITSPSQPSKQALTHASRALAATIKIA